MEGWFHFDAFELLDEKVPADAKPVGCRYDHQIAIFGKGFQVGGAGRLIVLDGWLIMEGCESICAFQYTPVRCRRTPCACACRAHRVV